MPQAIVTPSEKINAFNDLLKQFKRTYSKLLKGCNMENKEINISARVKEKLVNFNDENFLKNNAKLLNNSYNIKISEFVNESKGFNLSNFLDSEAFRILFIEEIKIVEKKLL